MRDIAEQDWDQLNAYYDGEMDPRDAVVFEQRLLTDPDLAEALACLGQMTQGLQAMHPIDDPEPVKAAPKRTPAWLLGGLLAASVALGVVVWSQSGGISAQQIHQEFAAQPLDAKSVTLVAAQSRLGFPDLTISNLRLVSSRDMEIGSAAHYAGRNGCRLTLLRMKTPVSGLVSDDAMQVRQWAAQDQHFALIATGMDHSRFEAIADYLAAQTAPSEMLAQRVADHAAKRCA